MKKIYIIQMHTKTIPAKFIRFFTHYNYSHIAISFDKSCNIIYSAGRKKYNTVLDAGFVEESKNGLFFKKFFDTNCRIFELEVTEKHEELFKYDYLGIILRFFKLPINFKDRYVCSYLVAKLLQDSGVYNFHKELYFIEPKDFEKIPNTQVIYKGNFIKYQ